MYYLYIFGSLLTSVLPRSFCYPFARFLAIAHYYLSRSDREAVIYNLSPIVKEPAKLRRYSRQVFVNFAYYLVDFFRYAKLNRKFIDKYVNIEGLENLNRAIAEGKGVIAFTAHLGNYELAGAVISLLGYPLSAVALSHEDKRTNRFFDGQRQRVGIKVIPTGAAVRNCFAALKAGDMLAFLGDRDFSGRKIKLAMFSRPAYFPRGIAFFALKAKAPILPAFLVRKDKKFYHLVCEEPIVYNKEEDDEIAVIEKCKLVLEKYIGKYPQQWYMFRKYWLES